MARLVVLKDGHEKKKFALEGEKIRIGSADGSEIRIRSDDVSREHCEIRRAGVQFRLVDLESKSGTKVNGSFVNQHLLEQGDEIELGPLVFRFEREGTVPRVAPRPGPVHPVRPGPGPMPVVVLSVGVALALIVVVILAMGGDDEDSLSGNEQLLREMQELQEQGQYLQALGLAERADENGDQAALQRIRSLTESIRYQLRGRKPKSLVERAREEAEPLLMRAARGEARLAEVDRFLGAYGHLRDSYVDRVRALKRKMESRAPAVAPREVADDLADRWSETERKAGELRDRSRYQEAIDAYGRFLDRNQIFMKSEARLADYRARVDDAVGELRDEAETSWTRLDERARSLLAEGERDRALRLYRRVVESYGIPIYEERAAEAIRSITGR
jgi:hypothetical protein